jgi:alanyl-tRNA synthetase
VTAAQVGQVEAVVTVETDVAKDPHTAGTSLDGLPNRLDMWERIRSPSVGFDPIIGRAPVGVVATVGPWRSIQELLPLPRELTARRSLPPDLTSLAGDRKRSAGVSVSLQDLPRAVASGRCHLDGATTVITTDQTIHTFVEFFRERGHELVPDESLVSQPGDPVLFTTSGMHPLTPYLLGRPHPKGCRLTGLQRCLRTTDLDEVGDDTHLTVFEMLGSWSLGDYDGPQSLRWGYELLCDGFGIDPERIHVTVFGGDEHVGPDHESWHTWGDLGVPVEPTTHDNWWSNGPTGLCGPDSEIFVWTGLGSPQGTPTTDDRWVEVWNHVMMRYVRHRDGSLEPLGRTSVDTGLGLERLVRILQNTQSVFEIDLLQPWLTTLPRLWVSLDKSSVRLLSDHLRSSIVILGDRIMPSTTGRGYVLRRLIRRVLTTLWREDPTRTLSDLPVELIEHTLGHFRQLRHPHEVRTVLLDEERKFALLLQRGRQVLTHRRFTGPLSDSDYRYLHDTHGLPRDLVAYLRTENAAEADSSE